MNDPKTLGLLLRLLFLITLICSPLLYQNSIYPAAGDAASGRVAYIEPGLTAMPDATLSVIVSALDMANAARAVRQAGGQVTSQLWLIDAVAARIPNDRLYDIASVTGVKSIVLNKTIATSGKPAPRTPTPTPTPTPVITTTTTTTSNITTTSSDGWVTTFRFPVPWDGTPDVQPSTSWNIWKVVYPVKVDSGAEKVTQTGSMVTVAVVDSGVYFDEQVKSELGVYASKLFLGQADFIDTLCQTFVLRNKTYSTGQQYPDHCFNNYKFSRDPYGHGTHVAGSIWNRLSDQLTGQSLGMAFEANILACVRSA